MYNRNEVNGLMEHTVRVEINVLVRKFNEAPENAQIRHEKKLPIWLNSLLADNERL